MELKNESIDRNQLSYTENKLLYINTKADRRTHVGKSYIKRRTCITKHLKQALYKKIIYRYMPLRSRVKRDLGGCLNSRIKGEGSFYKEITTARLTKSECVIGNSISIFRVKSYVSDLTCVNV